MIDQAAPLVSLILCSYENARTVARSLQLFSTQSYKPIEIIMVDSSPGDETEVIVRQAFPQVIFTRSRTRLLPNEAHHRGVQLATGDLYVFTDPGIYAPMDWIEALVGRWRTHYGPVRGCLDSYSMGWFAMGAHLCKFDQVLPGGAPGPTELGPTSVLLCPATVYRDVGGFRAGYWLADALFSWQLAKHGHTIVREPGAVAQHHHVTGIGRLLRERYVRGREFGKIRMEHGAWRGGRRAWMVLVSVLPLRLFKWVLRALGNARRTSQFWRYALSLPLAAAGQAAWLLGEARQYVAGPVVDGQR